MLIIHTRNVLFSFLNVTKWIIKILMPQGGYDDSQICENTSSVLAYGKH